MARFKQGIGLDFNNVLLVPKYSTIDSRSKVSLQTILSFNPRTGTEIVLQNPIVSANMDTITGIRMVKAMTSLGCTGILHRYEEVEDTTAKIKTLKEEKVFPIIPSIGVCADAFDTGAKYLEAGASAICIDIAHGHSEMMMKLLQAFKIAYPQVHLIAGNIVTKRAAIDLIKSGATALKVGVGPGSKCLTRIKTGAGVPQLTALLDVCEIAKQHKIPVIADGGIKEAGDITKALAAGASTIMTGYLLSGTDEAIYQNIFRGMASKEAKQEWTGKVSYIEGETDVIPSKGSVIPIVQHLLEGIRSGLSYSGAWNIKELWENAEFVEVSH